MINYQIATERDIHFLAAMHTKGSRETLKRSLKEKTSMYEYFKDKVELFFNLEKEGVIVARDEEGIVGNIIVTKSMKRIKIMIIIKGYLVKWAAKAIIGRYGLNIKILKKLMKIFMSLFLFTKHKLQSGKSRGENLHSEAKIISVIVIEEKRKQGIGTELIKQACEYLSNQKIENVAITVAPNSDAKRLYEKLGFIDIGTYQESVGKSIYMIKRL